MLNLNFFISARFILTLVFISVIFFSLSCFGQDPSAAVTSTDPAGFIEEIIKLVAAIKGGTLGGWALATAVLTLILQAFKLKILSKIFC